MPTRNAHARWVGSLKEGGQVNFGSRLFTGAYSQTLPGTEITLEARLAAKSVAPLGGTP